MRYFKEMQVVKAFSFRKRFYKLKINSNKSLNKFPFWSYHLIYFEFILYLFSSFYTYKVSLIENLDRLAYAYFLDNLFKQKSISVRWQILNTTMLHAEMLVLKRLRCNVVNDLAWFICLGTLSKPDVFF